MCYVRIGVESVSLRRKKFKHAHKAWYILGVLLKISIMHLVLFIYEFPQGDFPKLQHGDNAISCRPGSTRTFLDCSVPYFPVISCISIVEFDRSGRIQNARERRDRAGHHASNPRHPIHMQVLPSHRVIGNYNLTEKEGTVNGPAHSRNLEPFLICTQTELSSAQLIGC